jgi:hypothetical protein
MKYRSQSYQHELNSFPQRSRSSQQTMPVRTRAPPLSIPSPAAAMAVDDVRELLLSTTPLRYLPQMMM